MVGEFTVRWERQNGMPVMWLSGALDQATVTLLDRELDGLASGLLCLVIDLTRLVFIDSAGLDALVGIHWRASKRGDQLTFRHGTQVALRPTELTKSVRRRSRVGAAHTMWIPHENFCSPLVMASVDVDLPPLDDQPEAA